MAIHGSDTAGHGPGIGNAAYLSGADSDGHVENWDANSVSSEEDNKADCEERDEMTFQSGARYKGQWRGKLRHGQGE